MSKCKDKEKQNNDAFFDEVLPKAFMEGFTRVINENVENNSLFIKVYQQTKPNNYLKLHHLPMRRKKTGTRKLKNVLHSRKKKQAVSLLALGRSGMGKARYFCNPQCLENYFKTDKK